MKVGVRDAARMLATSESDLYRWIEAGEIPFQLVNHQPLFNRTELLEWATSRRLRIAVELFADEGTGVRLADALERGGIHRDLPGADLTAALRAILARLPIDDEVDRALATEILLAREREVLRRFGAGIAIPHARTPIVFADRPPAIATCHLARPISLEAEPISTVFLMMTPTVRVHLQLLAHLAHALHDARVVAALARDPAAALAEIARVDGALHPTEAA